MLATHAALEISDPNPFGEVTLVPAALSGRSESQVAHAMAEAVVERHPESASQALQQLRVMFPESSLMLRVAALNALMRR